VSFVTTSALLAFWCFLIAACLFYLSGREPRRKGVIDTKWLLFAGGLAYLILSHFAIFIAIGQGLDENYEAPCEWLLNHSEETYIYGNNFTDYHWEYTNDPSASLTNEAFLFHKNITNTYYDTCAGDSAPAGSSALVVTFTWLFYILTVITIFGIIIQLTNAARRMF